MSDIASYGSVALPFCGRVERHPYCGLVIAVLISKDLTNANADAK
jgi:hypothetical protein